MLSQAEKATLSVHGSPQRAIEDLDLDPILDSVIEDHKTRIQSAVEGNFRVYPRTDGLYIVESMDDGAVKDTYSVNLKNSSDCSCWDYLMRCTGQNMSCKHIWRVRILIKLDALPGRDQDSFKWLKRELFKDVLWLKERDVTEYLEEMESLQVELDQDGQEDVNYEYYMKKRSDILMQAKTADL